MFSTDSGAYRAVATIAAAVHTSAACTLPMAEMRLSGEMGRRHQAGLGVTEGTDAVSVMVSEETGMVSVAADGRLYARLDETRLRELLAQLLGSPPRDGERRA